MTNIHSYLNDGANWQAQCVLNYVRSHTDLSNDYAIFVGRYENCREQGYVFTLTKRWTQLLHIAVYEHRNSDSLVAKTFKGSFLNTPRAEDLNMKDKWDFDAEFEYGNVVECGKYVVDTFGSEIIKNNVQQAIEDYNELKERVENYKGTFDELFDELKGHNKDNDVFDVNFKSINSSVYIDDDGNIRLSEYLDSYTSDHLNPVYENISIKELQKLI